MGLIFIIGLLVCLIGSSFIAGKVFKSIWKTEASVANLTAYMTAFALSFTFLLIIVSIILTRGMNFGR